MFLERKHRERSREIACCDWVESGFDEQKARALTKKTVAADKAKGVYGNPLVAIMIGYYVAAMCYMAYKIWRERQVKHPPEQPEPGEPFGLFEGAK